MQSKTHDAKLQARLSRTSSVSAKYKPLIVILKHSKLDLTEEKAKISGGVETIGIFTKIK